jgi:maltodextrin utilization protein YvdJ
LISLIGSLVFAISISAFVLPKAPEISNYVSSKAKDLYPKGLVVNIKDGIVTTNEEEPFFVDTLTQFNLAKGYEHVLTIDTSASPSDIKKYKTFALITKDSVVTIQNNDSYQVRPIDKETNLTIDEKTYDNLISQITPYLKYLQPALIAVIVLSILIWPFISAFFSMGLQTLYLIIFSIIFFLLVKIMKKEISFKKLFQLTIHASTLPIILGVIISTLGIHMPFLLGSAILFVFMVLVINEF